MMLLGGRAGTQNNGTSSQSDGDFTRQPRNGLDSPPNRLKLQMRVVLVHVFTRVAGQLLTDLERNVGSGHRRIEAVSVK
jgi:hypothetical protein